MNSRSRAMYRCVPSGGSTDLYVASAHRFVWHTPLAHVSPLRHSLSVEHDTLALDHAAVPGPSGLVMIGIEASSYSLWLHPNGTTATVTMPRSKFLKALVAAPRGPRYA